MQRTADKLEKSEVKELLNKCWMTHDAMWFYHCLREVGIETTNKINLAAVRSMSVIEIKRIRKLLGVEKRKIDTFEELIALVEGAFAIVKADFMNFSYSVPEKNVIRWDMQQCFAHDGVSQIGAISGYQCGIIERIKGWLDGLGVSYSIVPEINGCLMHAHGKCCGEFRTNL